MDIVSPSIPVVGRIVLVQVQLGSNFGASPSVWGTFKVGQSAVGSFGLHLVGSLWTYTGAVPAAVGPGQPFTIEVGAHAEIGSPVFLTVDGVGSVGVTLEYVEPSPTIDPFQTPVGTIETPFSFTLKGSASTPGYPYAVSQVQYQIGSGTFTNVNPFTPDGTIGWTALVSVPNLGETVITVRATDNYGTSTSTQQNISVLQYHPVDDASLPKTKDLQIPTSSSITSWTRLEPQVSRADMTASSNARLFDPLWMMTRQWQMGEFQAEDGGSPVQARVRATTAPLSRLRFPNTSPFPYDPGATPLETLVEHRRTRAASQTETLSFPLRIEAGMHFLRMLEQRTFTQDYHTSLRDRFALLALSVDAEARVDDATRRFVRTTAGRALDATRLAALVRNAPGTQLASFLPGFGIASADVAGMVTLMRDWLAWYDALFVEPGSATVSAWTAPHLEYTASVAARLSTVTGDSVTLSASEFDGGRLEWSSFDVDRTTPIDTSTDTAFTTLNERTVPAPVSFPGAPAPRFWEMEDARVAYGLVPVGPTDLAHLMMIEYSSSYGNDWYTVPLTTPVGSVTRVDSLIVTDTFGVRTLVRPIGDPALPTPYFSMWQQSTIPFADDPQGSPVRNRFFLPPTIARSIDGPVLEDVLFARDEMANVAWAIERSVEGGVEAPVSLTNVARTDVVETPAEAFAPERYLLASPVPANWIPLLPVQKMDADGVTPLTRLQRGALLQPDGTNVPHTAQSEVLKSLGTEPLFDEEVPREGAHITRRRRMVRWTDGSTWAWTAFRNDVGTGEGSSGLQFDQLQSTEGAVLVNDVPPEIATLFTGSSFLSIEAPSVPYTVTFFNDGPTRPNVSIRGWVVQGGTRRAGTPSLFLSFGSGTGVLPHGTWTLDSNFVVSNQSEGTGTLVPGAASFELQLIVDGTVLETRTVPLSLLFQATIGELIASPEPLVVNGAAGSFTATLQNYGSVLTNVELHGWISQGTARRAAGGTAVMVGGATGELPVGTFPVAGSIGASNGGSGSGTLVAGPATFEVELVENGTVRHSASVPVTLEALPATITVLSLPTTLMIDGIRPTYNYTLENTGPVLTGMSLKTRVVQGTTVRGGTFAVSVGAGSGVLSTGSFNRTGLASAYNNLEGAGTLVPGPATFELQLLDGTGTVVSSKSVAVTLVAKPVITAFNPSATVFVLNGPAVAYTATIENPGPSLPMMSLTCSIVQGNVSQSTFPGLASSTLPSGTKNISASIAAPSSTASGTLVPGAATLQFKLVYNFFQIIAIVSVPVTLTSA